MNIGIVTTWFERGASYVSRQFMDVLSKTDNVSDAVVKKINRYDKRDGRRYATMLSILYHIKHIF